MNQIKWYKIYLEIKQNKNHSTGFCISHFLFFITGFRRLMMMIIIFICIINQNFWNKQMEQKHRCVCMINHMPFPARFQGDRFNTRTNKYKNKYVARLFRHSKNISFPSIIDQWTKSISKKKLIQIHVWKKWPTTTTHILDKQPKDKNNWFMSTRSISEKK